MGLKSATFWATSGYAAQVIIKLVSNLFLTRLVLPEDYGIMAAANIIMLGAALVSEIGIRQSIIRATREVDQIALRTAFTLQVIRGVLLSILILMGAAFLYLFQADLPGVYANSLLPLVVAYIALNPLIVSFESTKIALASRKLEIGKVTTIEVVGQFSGLIVGVGLAQSGHGVWALATAPLIAAAFRAIFSHVVLSGSPDKFGFSWVYFKEYFHFGKWIFLSSLMGFLSVYGDQAFVAAWSDASYLALYSLSFFVIAIVRQFLSKFSNEVALARLSDIHRSGESIKIDYYALRKRFDFFVLFVSGALFVSGDLIIEILYDDRYSGAGGILSIMSLSLIFDRYVFLNTILMTIGRPRFIFNLNFIRCIALSFLPLYIAEYGVEDAIYFVVMYRVVPLFYMFYVKHGIGVLDLKKEALLLLFLIPGVMAGFLFQYIVVKLGLLNYV